LLVWMRSCLSDIEVDVFIGSEIVNDGWARGVWVKSRR
jgi:hypothetical protein